jgi:hypothetical protein
MICACLLGQLARRDLRVSRLNEQPFRGIEKGLFGVAAGG